MRRLPLIAALVALSLAPAFAEDYAPYAGTYSGSYDNGEDYFDMTTVLSVDAQGHLVGDYEYDDQGETASGTLALTEVLAPYLLLFTWEDQYGSGTLKVLFAEDYSSFLGYWGGEGMGAVLPWVGERDNPDEDDGEDGPTNPNDNV